MAPSPAPLSESSGVHAVVSAPMLSVLVSAAGHLAYLEPLRGLDVREVAP
ncbi:MAG TPA: hypothetical protein VFO94_01600 [Gammaproteobacteria bacterium]|nr:hypothetical protein [Gammaproteobacteria bacterium]